MQFYVHLRKCAVPGLLRQTNQYLLSWKGSQPGDFEAMLSAVAAGAAAPNQCYPLVTGADGLAAARCCSAPLLLTPSPRSCPVRLRCPCSAPLRFPSLCSCPEFSAFLLRASAPCCSSTMPCAALRSAARRQRDTGSSGKALGQPDWQHCLDCSCQHFVGLFSAVTNRFPLPSTPAPHLGPVGGLRSRCYPYPPSRAATGLRSHSSGQGWRVWAGAP